MADNSLIGTWRLITAESRNAEGQVEYYPWGSDAKGYIMYSNTGHVSVMIMSANRLPFSSEDVKGGTTEEKADAFETFVAYSGTYEVHGDKVIHHIEICSFPNWIGADQERFFEIRGDRLSLKTPPLLFDGIQRTPYAIWKRV